MAGERRTSSTAQTSRTSATSATTHTSRTSRTSATAATLHTPLVRLAENARQSPSAIALAEVDGARIRRQISRAELVRRVHAVMRGLSAQGFAPGDRVLFSVRPGINAVVLVLAVHELGGVLIPQDPGTADALFASRLQLLAPQWVVAESILLLSPASLLAGVLRWRGIQLAPLGAVPGARIVRVGRWLPGVPVSTRLARLERLGTPPGEGRTAQDGSHGEARLDGSSEAFIVCTSGTTSAPKAVVHTRDSLSAILHAVEHELAIDASHVVYSKDLHLVLPALAVGARALMPRRLTFCGDRTLAAFQAHEVTHAFLVTRDCRLLLERCVAQGTTVSASLQSLMIGAAPVRTAFLSRLRAVLPARCIAWCVYGATEVLPIARVSLEEKVAWGGDGDLVGRAIPGVVVRLDEHGQLLVRGDRLCAGYAGAPAMQEYATGDLARLDGERIVLLGRSKDMLIRGDYNIYPELYEPLVERIAGVRRAAIIGDFDPADADERMILVVEPEAGVDAAALRERVLREVREGPHRLDATAQPDEIVVRALPESGRSGKVDKGALRAQLGARACA